MSEPAAPLHKKIKFYILFAVCLSNLVTALIVLIPLNHHLTGSELLLITLLIVLFTGIQIAALLYLVKPLAKKLLLGSKDMEELTRNTDRLTQSAEESSRAEKESRLLQTVIIAIASSKDIREALTITLSKICEATSWAAGDAWLFNPQTNTLDYVCSYYDKDKTFLRKFEEESGKLSFSKGEGLPGYAWKTKNSVWINTLAREPFFTRRNLALELGIKSGMAVPIPLNNEVIAVLCFYMLKEHNEDKRIVDMITAVAGQLGMLLKEKQTEESLKESELRFRSLVESSPEAIILSDSNGNIISINSGTERMFGYTAKEMMYQPITMIMPERYREPHRKGMERYKATGEKHVIGKVVELQGLKKEGKEFSIELSIATWTSRNEIFFSGIIRDISDRKSESKKVEMMVHELRAGHEVLLKQIEEKQAAQKALEKAYDELEDRVRERTAELTQTNEELKSFSYIVSHDLKAPLRAIGSLTDMILSDESSRLSQEGKDMFNMLKGRVKRMDQLINGILHYSRIGRVETETSQVDLNELVAGIIENIGVPENIKVEIKGKLPTILTEPVLIGQVFQNLLDNAIKYMNRSQGLITIGRREEDDEWMFSVADNGPGIDPQYHEKIFQIFQTLQPRDVKESTGIGLTIVQKIVKRLGGKIWLESKPGEGTTFFFTLPKES